MDFPKVAACCVGVAVVVRGTDYRYHLNFGFLEGKPKFK